MDKEKIKKQINDADEIMTELVVEGKLDGDQKKQMLFSFSEETIKKEFFGNAEVV